MLQSREAHVLVNCNRWECISIVFVSMEDVFRLGARFEARCPPEKLIPR